MQIHELNDFSGNLDSGAYLGIDNGYDTGKVSAERLLQDVNLRVADAESQLNARIDNIIAGGDAPSEAEITDARQGAAALGSVNYPSLGEAIRGQIGLLADSLFDPSQLTFTDGKFIDNYGQVYDSALWALSDPIPVEPGYKIRVHTDIQGTAAICFLDQSGALIGNTQGTSGVKDYDLTVPEAAATLRFPCWLANKASAFVTPLYISDSVLTALGASSPSVFSQVTSDDVISGFLITRDGYVAGSDAWDVSGYIPVIPSSEITVKAYCFGTGGVVFYDSELNVLFGIDGNNASSYGGGNNQNTPQYFSISNAENIAFIRFCSLRAKVPITDLGVYFNSRWSDYAVETYSLIKESASLKGRKVLVIGDSISQDSYGNYNKWVTNLIVEGKLSQGNTVNSSQHATGFVADYNGSYQNFNVRIANIEDKDSFDMVIVFGGINDYIQNIPLGNSGEDKDTYFKPAVDYFFDYLIKNFTQARLCVLLPLRNDNVNANTAGNKQEVYSQYIHDVAKSYCLPVLNLTEESGFCPFITEFKNKWTLIPSGYSEPDGTHPTAEYEKKYLTPMIWDFISGLI